MNLTNSNTTVSLRIDIHMDGGSTIYLHSGELPYKHLTDLIKAKEKLDELVPSISTKILYKTFGELKDN